MLPSKLLQNILEDVVKKESQKNHSLLDVLLYLPSAEEYPQKKQLEIEEEEEEASNLEIEVEEIEGTQKKEDADLIQVRYPSLEENLLPDFSYQEKAADDKMYNGITPSFYYEEGYVSPAANDNAEADLSLNEEVVENLDQSKYDFIVNPVDVDFEQQERIATWILLNPALFTFLEYINNWNRETNYRSAA